MKKLFMLRLQAREKKMFEKIYAWNFFANFFPQVLFPLLTFK
jgi:hypothetical protein